MIKKILKSQIIKFGLVGFLNTAVDFGIFTLLTAVAGLASTISHVISYCCGVLNSYFFNRTWTFKQKNKIHLKEFLKFLLVNLASLGLSTLVLNYLETEANLSVYLAKAGATICSMAINFVGSKLLVFKK
ncbi:MAG: GtrA family protein [Clostridiales bacterium]|nr:GtrA family protein [Clostridiales bacterium]